MTILPGYMTWGMPDVPFEASIPFLAGLGFRAVEVTVLPNYADRLDRLDSAARRRLRRLLTDHGLALPAVAAHFGLLAPPGVAAEAQRRSLDRAIGLAADLALPAGPPVLDTTVGAGPGDWAAVRDRLVQRLGDLCRQAAAEGVTIAVEPHVHSCLDGPERVSELLGLVDAPNLRVNLDISHFAVRGLDVGEVCRVLGPLAAHTHVKDQRGTVPDFVFLVPGEGDFDAAAFLVGMAAAGYTGAITVEVSIMAQRRPGYDALAAARASAAWLLAAFARAGLEPA